MKQILTFCLLLLSANCWSQLTLAGPATLAGTVTVGQTAAAWTPSNLGSPVKIWLRNTSVSGNNGDAFKYWADSSGNGYHATNSAATTYVTNTGLFASGIKSVYFNGDATSQLYLSNALSVARNIGSMSVVAVVRQLPVPTANHTIILFGRNVFASSRAYVLFDQFDRFELGGRRLDAEGAPTFSDTSSAGITNGSFVVQMDADWANSNAQAWTNNVQVINDTTWLTDGNTSDTDSVNVTVGGTGAAPNGEYFKGWMAELIVVVPKVSAADRTNLWNYAKVLVNE